MKKAILLLTLVIIAFAQAFAQSKHEQLCAAPSSSLRVGFTFPEGFTYANRDSAAKAPTLGIGNSDVGSFFSALIEMPQIDGMTIKGLSYVTDAKDPYGRICIATRSSSDPTGTYTFLVVEEVETTEGLNTFTFKNPHKMLPGKVYAVGYECVSSGKKEGIEPPPSWRPICFVPDIYCFAQAGMVYYNKKEQGSVVGEVGKKQTYMDCSNVNWGNLAIVANLEDPEGKLTNLASFAPISTSEVHYLGSSFPSPEATCKLPVVNLGRSDISKISFEIKSPYGGTEKQEFAVNMKPTQGAIVNFPLTTKGRGRLAFTLSKVNGRDNGCKEARLVSNTVSFAAFTDGEAVLRNKLLIEYFTTEQSYQSPQADSVLAEAFEALKAKGKECIIAAHHTGYKRDMLTLPNSEELRSYYVSPYDMFFAPGIVVSRTFDSRLKPFTSKQFSTLLFPNEAKNVEEIVKMVSSFPSEVVIESIEQATNPDKTRNIVIKGKDLSGKLAASKELFLSIYRTEDGIPAKAQLGKDEKPIAGYIHNNAIREFVTPTFGTPVESWNGSDFTITVSNVKVDEQWDNTKNHFVVFIHRDIRTEDPNMRIVYAANSIGVHQMSASRELVAESRPLPIAHKGRIEIVGAYDSFVVYDLRGSIVGNNSLPAGIYIVKMRLGEVDYVSKLVIHD